MTLSGNHGDDTQHVQQWSQHHTNITPERWEAEDDDDTVGDGEHWEADDEGDKEETDTLDDPHLIQLCGIRDLMKTVQQLANLQKVVVFQEDNVCRLVDNLLLNLYWLVREGSVASHDDRQILGPLLHTCLPTISWFMNRGKNKNKEDFPIRNIVRDCIDLSGLHILVDDYGNCPIDNNGGTETLERHLICWVVSLDLSQYDARMVEFTNGGDDGHYDKDYVNYIAKLMPPHHVWWRQVADKLNVSSNLG
jgi:hypothetical protein